MNIREFLKPKTLSDFVKLEDGIVGGKTALNIAAVVGASILAELFLAGTAHATCCSHSQWWDGTHCHHDCSLYTCSPPGSVWNCPPSGDCVDTVDEQLC